MSTIGRRVALLARPGVACDRLRGALVDAGADLVLEADPLTLDPATLDAVQAQVVLVALDAQTEEALDRFEVALQDPSIEVIFEEAELAARREGWEAARWVRHLAAKLHRHHDVLPPGAESGPLSIVDGLGDQAKADESGFDFDFVAAAEPLHGSSIRPEPEAASPTYAFDPLLAEIDIEGDESTDSKPIDASSAFDPSLNFSYDGDFDSVTTDVSIDGLSADQGEYRSSKDLSLDDFAGRSHEPVGLPQFSPMFDGDVAVAAVDDPPALDIDDTAAQPATDKAKRVLELVSTDGEMASGQAGYDGASDDGVAASRFRHDLAGLESRIAGMELVEDRVVNGPAQANGAVLVMAGIGGPDAVRQLLGALPENFPQPVLVQQRLDGGRYDKLVAQMQRATPVPVKLAEPGLQATAGVIYILPAGVGINVAETGIQFSAGDDDVLAALPSADSAILLLSGSDAGKVDAVMNHSWAGALVMAQSPDGCYDAAAPSALLARGGGSGQPAELAERLSEHWRS